MLGNRLKKAMAHVRQTLKTDPMFANYPESKENKKNVGMLRKTNRCRSAKRQQEIIEKLHAIRRRNRREMRNIESEMIERDAYGD